jgi:predicted kinase
MPLEVVVLVGLQGAGKSTFYRTRFAATHAIVSKDLMGRRARDKQARQLRELAAHLAARRSVVVDNTNPRALDRAPLVAVARAHGARVVCYGFALDVEGSHLRNRQRVGRACVPDVALFGTLARLEAPHPAEGFDALFVVRLDGRGGFDVQPL